MDFKYRKLIIFATKKKRICLKNGVKMRNKISLQDVSKILFLETVGIDGDFEILNLCNSTSQFTNVLSYVTSVDLVDLVKNNESIKGLFVRPEMLGHFINIRPGLSFVLTEYPEYDFYRLHSYLVKETDFYEQHNFELTVGKNCNIDRSAILENGVTIGDNVTIGPSSVVRKGSVICDNVTIGCNTVICSEGFQLIRHNGHNVRVVHVGGTLLKEGVEIGDNCAICNSLFEGHTIIGTNTKINNLVHVAHNCLIGNDVVIGGGVIFCGSCVVEDHVWIAPNSTINNRVRVGRNSIIGLGTKVIKSIPPYTKFFNKTENVITEKQF